MPREFFSSNNPRAAFMTPFRDWGFPRHWAAPMSVVTKLEGCPGLRGCRSRSLAVIVLSIHSCRNGTNDVGHGAFAAQIWVILFDHEIPNEEGLAIPILGEIKPACQGYNLFSPPSPHPQNKEKEKSNHYVKSQGKQQQDTGCLQSGFLSTTPLGRELDLRKNTVPTSQPQPFCYFPFLYRGPA